LFRCEDYAANRKGGAATGTSGLFGAPPNQTAPAGSTLFGATPAASQANPFGARTNKPLFGAQTATTGFGGATTTPFGAQGTSAFGASASPAGGLFGAKPQTSFGQPATASTSGFSFGQTTATSSAAGNLFGAQKPFGVAAPQAQGGMFGSTTPGAFGAVTSTAPAFGATNSFGQPAAQNQSINLFGNQKPTAFSAPFGQTAATTVAPAFSGAFGQPTNTFGMASYTFDCKLFIDNSQNTSLKYILSHNYIIVLLRNYYGTLWTTKACLWSLRRNSNICCSCFWNSTVGGIWCSCSTATRWWPFWSPKTWGLQFQSNQSTF
jgi:hypothetical protein